MRSTDDQSTIRWLLVVGLYCFRGLKIDFNQNLSLCDRCTKSVRVHQEPLYPRPVFIIIILHCVPSLLSERIIQSECWARECTYLYSFGNRLEHFYWNYLDIYFIWTMYFYPSWTQIKLIHFAFIIWIQNYLHNIIFF